MSSFRTAIEPTLLLGCTCIKHSRSRIQYQTHPSNLNTQQGRIMYLNLQIILSLPLLSLITIPFIYFLPRRTPRCQNPFKYASYYFIFFLPRGDRIIKIRLKWIILDVILLKCHSIANSKQFEKDVILLK